jgi:hypothetical protein
MILTWAARRATLTILTASPEAGVAFHPVNKIFEKNIQRKNKDVTLCQISKLNFTKITSAKFANIYIQMWKNFFLII